MKHQHRLEISRNTLEDHAAMSAAYLKEFALNVIFLYSYTYIFIDLYYISSEIFSLKYSVTLTSDDCI